MKRATTRLLLALLAAAPVVALPSGSFAQGGTQTGSIEFIARVTPTAGRAEPVRLITFYLLRRSLADIQKEVEETELKVDLDKFVDSLAVSKELKTWMKKTRRVDLAGADFLRLLREDDLLDVPEFYDAYLRHNLGDAGLGFPTPRYRESDRQQNPQKYEKLRQEFRDALRRFIKDHPEAVEGMDVHLEDVNPAQRWMQQEAEQRQRARRRALFLAQTRYLAAKSETDLEGRGSFLGVSPGEYWAGTLDTEAVAGDVRLRWDVPVTVRAGQMTRLELSNLNAVEPSRSAAAPR